MHDTIAVEGIDFSMYCRYVYDGVALLDKEDPMTRHKKSRGKKSRG
jgi:hypothetical protein